MKESIRRVVPVFNSNRMVQEYSESIYLYNARRYASLAQGDLAAARDLSTWLDRMHSNWHQLRILSVDSTPRGDLPVNAEIKVTARIDLGSLDPDDLSVQVYYGAIGPQGDIVDYDIATMTCVDTTAPNSCRYEATVSCNSSGLHGYAVRILPFHENMCTPHIPGLVLWSS